MKLGEELHDHLFKCRLNFIKKIRQNKNMGKIPLRTNPAEIVWMTRVINESFTPLFQLDNHFHFRRRVERKRP
jgi:hypothetical protein